MFITICLGRLSSYSLAFWGIQVWVDVWQLYIVTIHMSVMIFLVSYEHIDVLHEIGYSRTVVGRVRRVVAALNWGHIAGFEFGFYGGGRVFGLEVLILLYHPVLILSFFILFLSFIAIFKPSKVPLLFKILLPAAVISIGLGVLAVGALLSLELKLQLLQHFLLLFKLLLQKPLFLQHILSATSSTHCLLLLYLDLPPQFRHW